MNNCISNNLATKMDKIKESPIFAVLQQANIMQQKLQDVIILAAGEPDFDTPDYIKQAAIAAINAGHTKYTAVSGLKELRQAIIDKFIRDNNLHYELNQIIVSAGGKHSIYNALQVILNDGDEVIIPAPYWVSYPDMVLLSGGVPIFIQCDMTNNFKLTPEQLIKYITPKTKAIIINSPSNPTGMYYNKSELLALAKILINYPKIYIISDDLYEHLIFNTNDNNHNSSHSQLPKFYNIVNVMPELKNRTIVINGISKAYAMTGWRIGYAASGNSALIKAMDTLQSQSTSNPCSIAQYAAISALNGNLNFTHKMCQEFKTRHDYLIKRLNDIKGIGVINADGAFYIFFKCQEAINHLYQLGKITTNDDLAFANYLLNNYLLALVPGSAFGLSGYMRISFATNMDHLTKAIDRLAIAVQ